MLRLFVFAALLFGVYLLGRQFGAADGAFAAGFARPRLFAPQALAMVAVGLLAIHAGGGFYNVLGAFLAALAVGAFLNMRGMRLPEIDGAAALTVMALGLAVALVPKPQSWMTLGLAALCGVIHGYRLGGAGAGRAEFYVGGMLLAAVGLTLVGAMAGEAATRVKTPGNLKALLGAAIFGVGLHMTLLQYRFMA